MHYGKETQIIILGDIHRDSPNHSDSKWQEDLAYFRSQKNAYFLGMGDYLDSTSTTERECLGSISKSMHDTFRKDIQALQLAKIEMIADELKFAKGRIIGLVNGNHYFEFQSGINGDQKLAELLNTKYLGVCSLIRLYFVANGRQHAIDLFVHHGMGAARLIGGSVNRVGQMFEGVEADICVDEETEILTRGGWKRREMLSLNDSIACFDRSDDSVKWMPPTRKIEYDYSGEAISLKNDNVDILMHPKHRVVYKSMPIKGKTHKHPWLVKEADQFSKMTGFVKIPLAAKMGDEDIPISDSLIALCGWIIAEGTFDVSGIRLTQKHAIKCARIRSLLQSEAEGFSEWERCDGVRQFYIPVRHRKFFDCMLPKAKNIPEWAYDCSDRQFAIFLAALVDGDGTRCGPKTVEVYQSRESFIDDLQAACALHGYRTSKRFKSGGFKDGGWALCITSRQTTLIHGISAHSKVVDYCGKMWCVTVPTGCFIARRRGKVFVTANCIMGHDHKRGAVPATPRLFLDSTSRAGLKVRQRETWAVRSGSYVAAFRDGEANYNVDSCRTPASLGHVEMRVKFITNDKKHDIKQEIHFLT